MAEPENPAQADEGKKTRAESGSAGLPQGTPVEKEASMEIHPIHGPVLTLREFFVHLTIITLGILIALSLEGLLEWQHHRSLLREARENLAREISHNQKVIEEDLANIRQSEEQLNQIVETMQKIEKERPRSLNGSLVYRLSFGAPYSTSWNTANRSGALSYMSYDEVEKYTEIYDQQQDVIRLSQQALGPLAQLSMLNVVFAKDLKNVSDKDLEEIQRIANDALVIDQALEGASKALSDDYAKVISSH
jgi:hypothetical protein